MVVRTLAVLLFFVAMSCSMGLRLRRNNQWYDKMGVKADVLGLDEVDGAQGGHSVAVDAKGVSSFATIGIDIDIKVSDMMECGFDVERSTDESDSSQTDAETSLDYAE